MSLVDDDFLHFDFFSCESNLKASAS